MRRAWRRALPGAMIALVPVTLGLSLALLIGAGWLPNLIFTGRYQFDLRAAFSLGGLLLSLTLAGVLGVRGWAQAQAENARSEAQAADAASRRRFLQRLDHELKNPLTIIRLGVVNLNQDTQLTEGQRASLDRVAQQAQRLQKLVADLRWLTDIEARGLEKTPVQLAGVLEEAVSFSSVPESGGRDVDLNVQQVPWPLSPVLGDRDLLVVVFRNLLDNALKFTPPGGQVEVRATDDGSSAVVEVADTGSGIPPDEIPNIFEELYQGQNARDTSGSGLGLTLVQRIVGLHGGAINVRSRVGQGTVVTVRLPLAPAPEAR